MAKRDYRYIIVDTREKRPWVFESQKRDCLKYGDYSIYKGTTHIVIERKSLVDLFVTLSPGRVEKFINKLTEAITKLEYVFLFIECNITDVHRGIPHSTLRATYIFRKLTEIMSLGVQVTFVGNNREKARAFAETVLRNLG